MKYIIIFSTFLTINTGSLTADEISQKPLLSALTECSKITTDSKRLECFDILAKSSENSVKKLKVTQSSNSNNAQKQDLKPKELSKTEASSEAKIISNTQTNKSQPSVAKKHLEDFGKKTEATSSSISSRLKGEFKEWEKGQKLHLENGQVWVVKRANRGYKKLRNPMITITKNFFGGFTAQVEGLNSTARVQRIK